MASIDKLYFNASCSPANFSYSDLCSLIEKVGFVCRRQTGSHAIYKHSKYKHEMINIQNLNGKAKPYQVKQVLRIIDKYNLIGEA